mgnify:CR=1 FL=1
MQSLERELNLYAPGLGDKNAIIIANKLDIMKGKEEFQREQYESLMAASKGRPIFPISAKDSGGIDARISRESERCVSTTLGRQRL